MEAYSDFEEGYLLANRIAQVHMSTHDSYEEFAVLYRTNAQSRVLEESLRKRNIPYRIYGGLSFYQRKEVKDALSYFRLAVNPDDDEALRRIINFPARGIGETTVNKLLRAAIDSNSSIWQTICRLPEGDNFGLNSAAVRKLETFRELISGFLQMEASGADAENLAKTIIHRTGLMSMLLTDNTPENLSKQENLNELLASAAEFVATRTEEGNDRLSMAEFLGQVSLATDQDVKDADDEAMERVTLMTAHAAKGLEFNNVFIVGVEEELFPSSMSSGTVEGIEEETATALCGDDPRAQILHDELCLLALPQRPDSHLQALPLSTRHRLISAQTRFRHIARPSEAVVCLLPPVVPFGALLLTTLAAAQSGGGSQILPQYRPSRHTGTGKAAQHCPQPLGSHIPSGIRTLPRHDHRAQPLRTGHNHPRGHLAARSPHTRGLREHRFQSAPAQIRSLLHNQLTAIPT